MNKKVVCFLILAALTVNTLAARVSVVCQPETARTKVVAGELCSFLERMYDDEFKTVSKMPRKGDVIVLKAGQGTSEAFTVKTESAGGRNVTTISSDSERGLFCGAYSLLEKLGCGLYMSFETVPEKGGSLDLTGLDFSDRPLVDTRVMFNWHNFLTSCSAWDEADWQYFVRQSARMKYNAIMVHNYGNSPLVEFEHKGRRKPVGWLSSSDRGRDWKVEHVQDVRRLVGGDIFDGRVFGSEAAAVPDEERVDAVKSMMSKVFDYAANDYGMDVIFAYDFDNHSAAPQEIVKALPESARLYESSSKHWFARPDTPEGYEYYRSVVRSIMKDYPQINDLVVWSRSEPNMREAFNFPREEMPKEWQNDVDLILEKLGDKATPELATKAVLVSRVVVAVRKIMNEEGYGHVKVSYGSWLSMKLFFSMHELCEDSIGFHMLEHLRHVSHHEKFQGWIKQIASRRSFNIIQWAQNDNEGVSGRPALPPENFGSSLAEKCGADGFGVIHWNWRPLDLYFKNLQEAVWQNSKDESLADTLKQLAADLAGDQAGLLNEYLERWMAEAPTFASESGPRYYLIKKGWNIPKFIQQSKSRLALLEKLDLSSLTEVQRDEINFLKGHEKWLGRFFELNHQAEMYDPAIIAEYDPAEGVQLFAEAIKHGEPDPGEKGLLVSLNLKWLTYRMEQKQVLGKEPCRVNFQPTHHDPLAMADSKYTFTFDENGAIWAGQGEEETGCNVGSVSGWQEKKGDKLLGGSWIAADKKLAVKVADLHHNPVIPASTGRVELVFPKVKKKISFDVMLEGEKAGTVTLSSRKGITRKVFENVSVKDGTLNVVLQSNSGSVALAAAEYVPEKLEDEAGLFDGVMLEAEQSRWMKGCSRVNTFPGYSGLGFVDMGGKGSWVEWSADVWPELKKPVGTLTFRYANIKKTRTCKLMVDGEPAGKVVFKSTGGWETWETVSIKIPQLKKAATIRLVADGAAGGPNLDQLSISE